MDTEGYEDLNHLISVTFQLVFTAIEHHEHFAKITMDEQAAWVRDQLEQCGFPTTPVGASWGVLKR